MVVQYDEDMLQEICDNVNLLEYVEQTMNFEQRGSDYFARCIKHIDDTPSFSITPSKNKFYCFSCGRGGSIINYLMMYEGMSYEDAVYKAAKLASVDLNSMCQSQTVLINRKRKRETEKKTDTFLRPILDKCLYNKYQKGPVQLWLDEGIRQEELNLFEIRIDNDSNRIVYPVYDMDGNFINVKGRTLFKNYKTLGIKNKYINYFKIGVMDYFQGYSVTAPYIEESKEVKIFEALKSTMKLFGHGIRDTMSAEKHTLTFEQIQWLIKSDIENVVLCWDSDVSYSSKEVRQDINLLKRFMNVYIVPEINNVLGGPEAKNSPIDCGIDTWKYLYKNRKKIV